ncbi:FHA domain-containing protein [bacterium]|nr:FHA domain-containing protein [bacterium]
MAEPISENGGTAGPGQGFPTLRFSDGVWAGRSVALDYPMVSMGRGHDNDIVLEDTGISRQHCRFLSRAGLVQITDLHSTNGTLVNGQRVEKADLRDGDLIVLGTCVKFCFLVLSPEERELERTLFESAGKDAATGVHHRQSWLEHAEPMLRRFHRNSRPVSLALCAVDQYAQFCDDSGQAAGNALLLELCRKTRALGREALVGRTGAGEIALMLPGFNHARAWQRMQKLGEDLARHPIEVAPERLARATVSIGLVSTQYPISLDSLLSEAQSALTQAIRDGQNQVRGKQLESSQEHSGLASTGLLIVKQKRASIRAAHRQPIWVVSEKGDYPGQLLDLGKGGMRIQVPQELSPGWPVEIAPRHDPENRVGMTVKWQRGEQCGLRFLDQPGEFSWVSEVLRKLGQRSQTLSDRRGHARVIWRGRLKLNTAQLSYDGEVESIGYGGLSAESPLPPPVHFEGVLEMPGLALPARVVWVKGARFGLEFGALGPNEHQKLLELVKVAQQSANG